MSRPGSKKRAMPVPELPGGGKAIVPVSASDVKGEKPCIGVTYLKADHEDGLKGLAEKARKHKGTRQLYKELDQFLELVRQYKSIEDLTDRHCPKNGLKSLDEASRDRVQRIQEKYNIETGAPCHIHCKGNGGGAFVLHGFIVRNRFEILCIDPLHQQHS